MALSPGLSATVTLVVSPGDTAPAYRSGDVPVLATPRLVALCEEAAVAAVVPALGSTVTTVGARVVLDHLAPSAVGARVQATATLEAVSGRRLSFAVTVSQGDRAVARGAVIRVVVDREGFAAGASG
jgi:fluoroacetyl-CoA thioesterase